MGSPGRGRETERKRGGNRKRYGPQGMFREQDPKNGGNVKNWRISGNIEGGWHIWGALAPALDSVLRGDMVFRNLLLLFYLVVRVSCFFVPPLSPPPHSRMPKPAILYYYLGPSDFGPYLDAAKMMNDQDNCAACHSGYARDYLRQDGALLFLAYSFNLCKILIK